MIEVNNVKMYTKDETAKILNVSPYTVHRLYKSGQLHFVKVGRHLRTSEQSIEQHLTGVDASQKAIDARAVAKLSEMLDRLK